MEYLPGATLEAMIREPDFPISRALGIAAQIMRGLAAIHSVGVLHRDLKPANIIMDEHGKLKIADFGIARGGASLLTMHSGMIVGTITYLAPETLIGEEATTAVDYYALGAILYQLLTQRAPIDDDILARLLLRKVEEAPRNPQELREDIPDWLAKALMGLLEVDPRVRMKAVNNFAANLDTYAPRTSSDTLVSNLVPETLAVDDVLVDKPLHNNLLGTGHREALITKILLSVLVGLLMVPLSLSDTSTQVEFDHFDTLFRMRGEKTPRSDVAIISIDEQSYSKLSVPLTAAWPRELHTKLLRRLATYSPKRVVFDAIFFDESSLRAVDEELAAAIGALPTVLGATTGLSFQAASNRAYLREQLIRPPDLLTHKTQGLGNVTFSTSDGRVRDLSESQSQMFPALPSLAAAASGLAPEEERPAPRSLINYYGPARTIPTVPYYVFLSEDSLPASNMLKDKIVFVGLNLQSRTDASQRDTFVTPFDSITSGTEVHATATSNLLSKDWIQRLSLSDEVTIQALLAATFSLLLLVGSGYILLVYLTGSVIGVLALQYLVFLLGFFIPVVMPLAFGVFCGILFRILLGNFSVGPK
jgi:CHASE2 domain-containing sensor protein